MLLKKNIKLGKISLNLFILILFLFIPLNLNSNDNLEGVFNLSFGQGVEIKSVLKMIYEKLNKKFIFDESMKKNQSRF